MGDDLFVVDRTPDDSVVVEPSLRVDAVAAARHISAALQGQPPLRATRDDSGTRPRADGGGGGGDGHDGHDGGGGDGHDGHDGGGGDARACDGGPSSKAASNEAWDDFLAAASKAAADGAEDGSARPPSLLAPASFRLAKRRKGG